jgi:hypothetical protein
VATGMNRHDDRSHRGPPEDRPMALKWKNHDGHDWQGDGATLVYLELRDGNQTGEPHRADQFDWAWAEHKPFGPDPAALKLREMRQKFEIVRFANA